MDWKVRAIIVSLATATLTACGGGSGGGNDTASTDSASSVVAAMRLNAAPAAECVNGGTQLDTGIDSNHNGVLDSAEITNSQYICYGTNGADGLNTLVAVTD